MPPVSPADWFAREEVAPSITRMWEPSVHRFFRANIWLVRGREADLLIDFGMGLVPLSPALVRDRAKRLHAVATHAHVDHVGGFHEFDGRAAHRSEAAWCGDMSDSCTLAHLFRGTADGVSRPPAPDWDPASFAVAPAPVARTLDDGDEIHLGDFRFQVLHLPGHSPGSIGLWEPARRILFSGDAIYAGGLVDDVPGSDVRRYLTTMRRLAALDVDMVYAGHNEAITGAQMRAIAAGYLSRKGAGRDRRSGSRSGGVA